MFCFYLNRQQKIYLLMLMCKLMLVEMGDGIGTGGGKRLGKAGIEGF
jgi:hypothetical protein